MSQVATPELQQWIVEQARAGCKPEAVLAAMTQAGWQEDVAIAAMEAAMGEHVAGLQRTPAALTVTATRATTQREGAAQQPSSQAKPMPEPRLAGHPRQVDAGDRVVDVLVNLRSPRVVVFGNLLSAEECDELIAAATPHLKRSLTVETQTGGEALNDARTSDGMFFRRGENAIVSRIEARIARLLDWPLENGEGLQVLHYRPGAEYKPHYDYFNPDEPGTPSILKRGGQRVGTLVMYLNEPERGGGTTFPDVGLEVAPQRGNAVFFAYDKPHPSTKTLHGGAPVIAGDKWVATKWLREQEFK
ncbi:2OG-Fe(II) oxygenase [Hydrogenophaga sp. OTU3427]|uniref:2OG-Fe(II) oxygenase n=1 Tax=Hydrogenophaga sp. OTU3427 TaxID=3043856 RepID=UPI00313D0BF0